MKKCIGSWLMFFSVLIFSQNVGINTGTPHPSAILEVSADPAPTSSTTTKKGLLITRVALTSILDQTTIPSPANGLIVINTANAGAFPNAVTKDFFYYWDGAKWERLATTALVEKAVKPRVFYTQSTATQTFLPTDLNFYSPALPQENVVSFPSIAVLNVESIVTANADNSFTVNVDGLYDFSAFINFNPMHTGSNSFVNLKIQTSTDGGLTWSISNALSRSAWGKGAATYLKTINILSYPLVLTSGTRFRLTFSNPFGESNYFGTAGNPYIGTSTHVPVSKGIRVQLLDFNL